MVDDRILVEARRAGWGIAEVEELAGLVGWLNLWNPLYPDGEYILNLARFDERVRSTLKNTLHPAPHADNPDGEYILNLARFDEPVRSTLKPKPETPYTLRG